MAGRYAADAAAPAGAGTVLLVVLALLAPPAWRAWQRATPSPPPARVDPARAWRDAQARAAAAFFFFFFFRAHPRCRPARPRVCHAAHLAGGLAGLDHAVRALPAGRIELGLFRALCQDLAPDATNRALAQHLPATVRPSFSTLDDAQLLWRVAGRTGTLRLEILRDAARTDLDFASTLQAIRPAFARIALGAPAALAVSPPRDESGRPLPPPDDLPRMRQRNVVLQGPAALLRLVRQPACGRIMDGHRPGTAWRPPFGHCPQPLDGTA